MKYPLIVFAVILAVVFPSCRKEWSPGMPLAKENVRIGVLHITDPFNETSGYAYAHQTGIAQMQRDLDLEDSQILYRTHVDYTSPMGAESTIRELIARGANIIIATSWGYMEDCERLAQEYPSVIDRKSVV